MKVIKREERETWETDTAKGYEYPFGTTHIDCAMVERTGRFPLEGWYRNTKVDEMIFLKKGTDRIVFKNGAFDLKEDDAILIEKNEWFYWDSETKGTFVAMCNPAWSAEQGEYKTSVE